MASFRKTTVALGPKHFIFSLVLLVSSSFLMAQDEIKDSSVSPKKIFSIGAGINSGFVIVHTKDVAFTRGSKPLGLELAGTWQRNDSESVNICNCYPKKGVVVNYYNMGNEHLGKIISAAFLLEPVYKINRNLLFSFKAVIGAAYGTNPYDSITNPINHAYSLPVSAYLMLGTGLYFHFSDHISISASLNFNHVSNGGMHLPNKGIDWPTIGIRLNYQKQPINYYTGKRTKPTDWKYNSIRWDFGLFGIVDKQMNEHNSARFFPLVGIDALASKQVGNLDALTLATEVFTDPGHSMEVKVKDSVIASPLRAGLLVGHEFLLGRFVFGQQLGYYYFSQMPYERMYHRWTLVYRMNKHFSTGFSLLAHRQVADFFDLRIAYSFQKRHLPFAGK